MTIILLTCLSFLKSQAYKKVGPKREVIRVVDQTFLLFLLSDESENFPSALGARQVVLPENIYVFSEYFFN